jgi:hypothetical protein
MSEVEFDVVERRSWWERLFGFMNGRAESSIEDRLPADSLLAGAWSGGGQSVADVPEKVKAQIREEALLSYFNRLEAPLRLLLYATIPDREPPSAEHCHEILNVWRYELEHRVSLTPDTYCGAVQRYQPDMDEAYAIEGRCHTGDLLRIRVPCWRMFDRIVVRGEAELVGPGEESSPASETSARLAAVSESTASADKAEAGGLDRKAWASWNDLVEEAGTGTEWVDGDGPEKQGT